MEMQIEEKEPKQYIAIQGQPALSCRCLQQRRSRGTPVRISARDQWPVVNVYSVLSLMIIEETYRVRCSLRNSFLMG